MDDSGRLYVLGRSDIINIGGYKVDRLEVETVIRNSLPVKDVLALEGKREGLPVIQAFIEADPALVSRSMVVKACSKRLSKYKIPAIIEIREQFKRDANGKILKSSLESPDS